MYLQLQRQVRIRMVILHPIGSIGLLFDERELRSRLETCSTESFSSWIDDVESSFLTSIRDAMVEETSVRLCQETNVEIVLWKSAPYTLRFHLSENMRAKSEVGRTHPRTTFLREFTHLPGTACSGECVGGRMREGESDPGVSAMVEISHACRGYQIVNSAPTFAPTWPILSDV